MIEEPQDYELPSLNDYWAIVCRRRWWIVPAHFSLLGCCMDRRMVLARQLSV